MVLTKQQIIFQVTSDKKYITICRNLLKGNSLYKDLYQDLILVLLELPEERFLKIDCPDCYIYKTLQSMIYYGRLKNKYFSHADKKELIQYQEYDHSVDIKATQAKRLIEKLSWHDKKIIDMWMEGKSDRKISSEKKLPRYFVTRKIKSITSKVRQEIKMQELGQPIKVLLVIQKQTTALQYHRQYIPHERLQKTHGNEFKIEFTTGDKGEACIDGMTDEQLKDYQIIYYLRQISFDKQRVQPTLDRLRRLGLKVVLDIDDYWYLPKEHHWHKKYKENNVAQTTIDTLKHVDYVITTTPYFADRIREYNKNVCVLPNCISPDAKQFEIRKIESSRLRFGWIGGVFHQPDIEMIDECFSKINQVYGSKEVKDNVQISVGGFSCNYEYKQIEKTFTANYSFRNTDATYYNYLQQCTPTMEHISFDKPYRRLWGRDIYSYGELYNEIDVALVPLKENTFNKCKSQLKIIEAGWMKKAVICSAITPYKEYIRHGVNGLLMSPSRNNIDWYLSIRKLAKNPAMAKDMGEALHETIKHNFDLDTHNRTRADLYKSLI